MDPDHLARVFEQVRPQLRAYLTRMVVRPEIADELAQTVFVRALETIDRLPAATAELRAWLFRVGTNLAIDERRRHASWRETGAPEVRPDLRARHQEGCL